VSVEASWRYVATYLNRSRGTNVGGIQVRRNTKIGTLLVLVLGLAGLTAARADSEELTARLQKIRVEVSQTEKTIGSLKSEFSKLKREDRKSVV